MHDPLSRSLPRLLLCGGLLTSSLGIAQTTAPISPTAPLAPQAPAQPGVRPGGEPTRPSSQREIEAMRSNERSTQCSEATLPQEPVPVCKLTPPEPGTPTPPTDPANPPAGN